MTRRPPSIITEFIVMILAVCLVIGGLEGYLRVTAKQKSKLYEGIETVPEIADTYFQYVFLEKHATKDAWNNANYDPQLGWDYQIAASRIRGPRKTGPKPAGMFRVITLGDSFTWGIEVKDEECFPHYLEKILQGQRTAEVFNMGVGSYGIDQMLLKYLRHGRQLRPDVVVLGIYPHDYDRTRLSFYSYSKPIFRPDEKAGQYVLDNVPVPPPKEVYARLASSLSKTESDALVFLNNRVRKLFSTGLGSNGYYTETDRLVEYLLTRLKDELDKTGTKLLVVHIPPGHAFENDQALSKGKSEPQTAHLRALYAKLKLPVVDLLEALPQGRPLATVYRDCYIHRPDGSIGHFTPAGNAEVAKIIAEALKAKGMLKNGG
jgi:lysophospholipase L1-like esterase